RLEHATVLDDLTRARLDGSPTLRGAFLADHHVVERGRQIEAPHLGEHHAVRTQVARGLARRRVADGGRGLRALGRQRAIELVLARARHADLGALLRRRPERAQLDLARFVDAAGVDVTTAVGLDGFLVLGD